MAKAVTPLTIPSLPILFLLSLCLFLSIDRENIRSGKRTVVFSKPRGKVWYF